MKKTTTMLLPCGNLLYTSFKLLDVVKVKLSNSIGYIISLLVDPIMVHTHDASRVYPFLSTISNYARGFAIVVCKLNGGGISLFDYPLMVHAHDAGRPYSFQSIISNLCKDLLQTSCKYFYIQMLH